MSDPLGLINNTQNIGGIQPKQAVRPQAPDAPEGPSFKDVLMENIEQVNRMQQDAEMAIEDLASGKRDDMDAVLMAKQKADIAFQTLLQVRNKLMDAYEEVKQIRV
ncbi:flagellar hook-basal body complex protein FliE [Planctomycetota bacterium]|nr:flagellar hook-basal body complex protein FliE [Planctomycetota bacterium]